MPYLALPAPNETSQLFFFSAFLARFSLRVNWGSRLPLGFAFCSLFAMTDPFFLLLQLQ